MITMLRIVVLASAILVVANARYNPSGFDLRESEGIDFLDWPDFNFTDRADVTPWMDNRQASEYVEGFYECADRGVVQLPTINSYTVIFARGQSDQRCIFYIRSPRNANQTVSCSSSYGVNSSFAYYDGSRVQWYYCITPSQSPSDRCFKSVSWNLQSSYSAFLLRSRESYENDYIFCRIESIATTPEIPSELDDCECGGPVDNRIIGGEEAQESEFPFAAKLSVVTTDGSGWLCGGTLISDQFIVTAAHCTTDQRSITALLGANSDSGAGGITVEVLEVIDHPNYGDSGLVSDISLLRISPIDFGSTVRIRPVCLPKGSDSYEGTQATAIGWGTTDSGTSQLPENLMKVELPVLSNSDCSRYFNIASSMICAGGEGDKSACFGDSGGALLSQSSGNFYELIGATSFGSGRCETAPGVFTRITAYLPWINAQISQSSTCRRPS